jgi:hypothetical protein
MLWSTRFPLATTDVEFTDKNRFTALAQAHDRNLLLPKKRRMTLRLRRGKPERGKKGAADVGRNPPPGTTSRGRGDDAVLTVGRCAAAWLRGIARKNVCLIWGCNLAEQEPRHSAAMRVLGNGYPLEYLITVLPA